MIQNKLYFNQEKYKFFYQHHMNKMINNILFYIFMMEMQYFKEVEYKMDDDKLIF